MFSLPHSREVDTRLFAMYWIIVHRVLVISLYGWVEF